MTEISKPRIIALAISVGLGKFQTNDVVTLKACFSLFNSIQIHAYAQKHCPLTRSQILLA